MSCSRALYNSVSFSLLLLLLHHFFSSHFCFFTLHKFGKLLQFFFFIFFILFLFCSFRLVYCRNNEKWLHFSVNSEILDVVTQFLYFRQTNKRPNRPNGLCVKLLFTGKTKMMIYNFNSFKCIFCYFFFYFGFGKNLHTFCVWVNFIFIYNKPNWLVNSWIEAKCENVSANVVTIRHCCVANTENRKKNWEQERKSGRLSRK